MATFQSTLVAPMNPLCGSDAGDTLSRIHAVLGAIHKQREVIDGVIVDGASFGEELIHTAVCDAVRFAAEQVELREQERLIGAIDVSEDAPEDEAIVQ